MRKLLVLSVAFNLGMTFATPLAAGKGQLTELPFNATVTGWVLPFNEDADDVAARCGDAPSGKVAWAVASFAGWGPTTHLGMTYGVAEHCSYRPIDGPPDGTYGQGKLWLYAANGDMLIASYDNGESLSGPPVIQFMDYFTFHDGGTGRFTFASGGGVDIGAVDFRDSSFSFQMAGVISYSKR